MCELARVTLKLPRNLLRWPKPLENESILFCLHFVIGFSISGDALERKARAIAVDGGRKTRDTAGGRTGGRGQGRKSNIPIMFAESNKL